MQLFSLLCATLLPDTALPLFALKLTRNDGGQFFLIALYTFLTISCVKDDEYTQRGWLYGIKDGQYGLFPSDFVDPLSPRSIRKEIKAISRITQQQQPSSQRHHRDNRDHNLSGDSPVDDIDDDDVEDDDHYSGTEGDTWGRRGKYFSLGSRKIQGSFKEHS